MTAAWIEGNGSEVHATKYLMDCRFRAAARWQSITRSTVSRSGDVESNGSEMRFRPAGQNLSVKIPGSQQITCDENSSLSCDTQLGHEVRQGPPVPAKMTDVNGSARTFERKSPAYSTSRRALLWLEPEARWSLRRYADCGAIREDLQRVVSGKHMSGLGRQQSHQESCSAGDSACESAKRAGVGRAPRV